MSSLWQKADELARIIIGSSDEAETRLATAQLAVVVRDVAEQVGLRVEAVDHPIPEGLEVELTIKVRARVLSTHDSHRLSYELQLERRDFMDGRTVCVDADEIVKVGQ